MATMFVRHRVNDYAKWKSEYDAFDGVRNQMGVTGHGVFQAEGDPNDITAYHDFPDLETAKKFAGSAELKSAMQKAGVAGAPEIWFTTKA